jgi:hypothetical protein
MFRDLEPAFEQLFGEEWQEASPVNDIVATLTEYFDEDLEDRLVCARPDHFAPPIYFFIIIRFLIALGYDVFHEIG